MSMERWVKCLSPQNTFGVSGGNSVAAKSNTIEVNGDQFFKQKKTYIEVHLIQSKSQVWLNNFFWLDRGCFFDTPLLRELDTERDTRGSIVVLRTYITLKVLLVIEWRHELIANDRRSMARNFPVVCFSVMFTTQWLLLHHWHTSPLGEKTGSGNTFAESGFSCLLDFQLHDKSLIPWVFQLNKYQMKFPRMSLGIVIFISGHYQSQMILFSIF